MHQKSSAERRRTAPHAKLRARTTHRARRARASGSESRAPLKTSRTRTHPPRARSTPRNVDRNCINWPSFTLALVRAALLSSGHPLHLPVLLAHLQHRLRQRIRLGLDCGFYLRTNSTFLFTLTDPRNVHDDTHDPTHDLSSGPVDAPLAGSSLDSAQWYRSPAPLCVGDSPKQSSKSEPSISVDVESLADSRTRRRSRAFCPRMMVIMRTLGFRCLRTIIRCP
ncbi:uncharacterized protein B0H18DRAFT_87633 [Fomitopsis serialis]|uniref:uncharacterized protein n=1 Tax=Fomitopsis serialis TaxID=139415 RepID=UPI002008C55C|nr:uncharacterized protein B0H18DRAFT_87633 [Neoantrodia serialis]KAH9931553.1 hypothetical protein B0H18DRAFT_87633 [Neoantrodia serialis]